MAHDLPPNPVRDHLLTIIRAPSLLPTPELVESIRAVQARLLSTVESLPDASAARSRDPGAWSVRDLLRHVIDAEERVTAQIASLSAGRTPPEYNVLPGEPMQIAETSDTHAGILERLRCTNALTLEAVHLLERDVDLTLTSSHDFFGPLNAREWAGFQVFHDTDHTAHAATLVASAP